MEKTAAPQKLRAQNVCSIVKQKGKGHCMQLNKRMRLLHTDKQGGQAGLFGSRRQAYLTLIETVSCGYLLCTVNTLI